MLDLLMHPVVTTSLCVAAFAMLLVWYFWSTGKVRRNLLISERSKFAEYKEDMQHKLSMQDDFIARQKVISDEYGAEAHEWKQKYEELESTAYSVTDKLEENLHSFREETRGLKYKNEIIQALISGLVQSHNIKRPKLTSILNNLPDRLQDAKKFENILASIMREANKDERL
jgi:hypothetical protein